MELGRIFEGPLFFVIFRGKKYAWPLTHRLRGKSSSPQARQ
jgi:hypothetical protein